MVGESSGASLPCLWVPQNSCLVAAAPVLVFTPSPSEAVRLWGACTCGFLVVCGFCALDRFLRESLEASQCQRNGVGWALLFGVCSLVAHPGTYLSGGIDTSQWCG